MHPTLIELPTRIETQRLYLRPYQSGDGALLYAAGLRNHEHLAEFESGNVLMGLKDESHAEAVARTMYIDFLKRQNFFLAIFEKDTHAWAGQVYIGAKNWGLPEFMIGYVADVHHEGKGYITEAVKSVLKMLFEQAGAHRVSSACADRNTRSYRVMERCGMQREGHFRECKVGPEGRIHGDYHYAILRQEYLASP